MNKIAGMRIITFSLISVFLFFTELHAQIHESSSKKPAPFSPEITMTPPEKLLTETSEQPILAITCNESAADVFIDNVFYGTTPFRITELSPGIHAVRIEKNSFYPRMFYVELKNTTSIAVDVRLYHTTGFIDLKAAPADALILIDGSQYTTGIHPMYTGQHQVEVKKFGYKIWTNTITVYDKLTSPVNVVLETADFAVSNFKASRAKLNPDIQNQLGTISFSFSATAAGSAQIELRSQTETDVFWTYTFPTFTDWEQYVKWDGKDNNGIPFPDGEYTAVLHPLPPNEAPYTATIPNPVSITIDRTLRTPILSYKTGTGAIGRLPSACIMPKGFFQAGISGGKTFQVVADAPEPWELAANIVGSPCNWLEIGAAVSAGIDFNNTTIAAITGNIKTNMHIGNFYAAFLLNALYKDGFVVSAELPLEYARNIVSMAAVPGISFHPEELSWSYHLGAAARLELRYVTALLWGQINYSDVTDEEYAAGLTVVVPFANFGSAVEIGTEWKSYRNGAITMDVSAGYRILL